MPDSTTASIERYLTSADGTKLYASATGFTSNPPVIFIHGLGFSSIVWDRQFFDPRMQEDLYMIRYDMRGHGRSGAPLEAGMYESRKHAEDFKAVCEGFEMVKPDVVAWSIGGIIVVDVIELYGGSFLGNIIYCGGPGLTRSLHNNYIHPTLLSLLPSILSSDPDVIAGIAPAYVRSIVANPDEIFTYRELLVYVGMFLNMLPTARRHFVTRTQETERWEREIREKSVLMIQGELDAHSITDKLLKEADKWLAVYETRVLEGCGHSPAIERADEVNGYILSFVKRHRV